ncbi:hypothetical protein [Pseudoduganella sp. OTU4001]|uniref:hypothetical protein n=1 Tax=Pseudoduganella sp. OTU4001 TaxID=3043854 RepID=UPI00313B1C7F
MKAVILSSLLLLASQANAAGLSMTAGAHAISIVPTPVNAERTRLDISLEGAGRMNAAGRVIHFHLTCRVDDFMVAKRIVEGVGDCTMTALGGGSMQAHFQTLPGIGDRGHLEFSGASGQFAGVTGRMPVAVVVNPNNIGKPVFYVESE